MATPGRSAADRVDAEVAELDAVEHAWTSLIVVACVLAGSNVMANRVVPGWAYVPWNLAIVALLVTLAMRRDRLHPTEIGIAADDVSSGLRWGGGCVAVVVAVYGVGMALPWTRPLFEDDRASGEWSSTVYRALVAVPFGTVLIEEVAFRGVLPAMLARRTPWWRAAAWSSAAFGMWHVLPSWNLHRSNQMATGLLDGTTVGRVVTVAFAVVGTFAAGMAFCWLRHRSRSLVAPVLAHIATNSLGYVGAWLVLR